MDKAQATALPPEVGEQMAQAHEALRRGAETSKRTIAANSRALRAQKRAMDRLEATCKEHGIELIPEPTTQPQPRRQSR